jgi:hypothetical protein
LPLLTNTNRDYSTTPKNNNIYKILLYKNLASSSYNNFMNLNNSSPSVKYMKSIKKNKNIFTNVKIKKSYVENTKKSYVENVKSQQSHHQSHVIEKETQTDFSFFNNNKSNNKDNDNKENENIVNENNYNYNKDKIDTDNKDIENDIIIKSKKFQLPSDNEESSSNDCNDMKELEKIISKSTRNILLNNISNNNNDNKNDKKSNNKSFNFTNSNIKYMISSNNNQRNEINNEQNEKINEKNEKNGYILLKKLYKIKNYRIKSSKRDKHNKSSRNVFLNKDNYINNIYKTNNYYDIRNNFSLNKYQKFFSHNNKENINLKNKIVIRGGLMPYNNKNKFMQKKMISNLLDSSNLSKVKKSICEECI